jgi:hypothetical protein
MTEPPSVNQIMLIAEIGGPDSLAARVLSRGQAHTPRTLPPNIRKAGRRHGNNYCFANAGRIVLDRSDLSYAEGFAWKPGLPAWIHHAWAVARGSGAVDPTWGYVPDAQYVAGVRLGCVAYARHFSRTRDDALYSTGGGRPI